MSPSSITKHTPVAQLECKWEVIRDIFTLGKKWEFTNYFTVHKPFSLSVPFSRGNPKTRVLSQSGSVQKGGNPRVQVTTGNLTDFILSSPTFHSAHWSLLTLPLYADCFLLYPQALPGLTNISLALLGQEVHIRLGGGARGLQDISLQ